MAAAPPVLATEVAAADAEEAAEEAADEAALDEVVREPEAEADLLATAELKLATAELTEAEAEEMALLALLMALETALPVVAEPVAEAEGDTVDPEMEAVGAPSVIWEVLEATVLVLSMTK